jgi:hypothetical protein
MRGVAVQPSRILPAADAWLNGRATFRSRRFTVPVSKRHCAVINDQGGSIAQNTGFGTTGAGPKSEMEDKRSKWIASVWPTTRELEAQRRDHRGRYPLIRNE